MSIGVKFHWLITSKGDSFASQSKSDAYTVAMQYSLRTSQCKGKNVPFMSLVLYNVELSLVFSLYYLGNILQYNVNTMKQFWNSVVRAFCEKHEHLNK